MNRPLIIYHNNCYDGITAAWVCRQKFGPDAEYVGLNYSDGVPNVIDRDVVIVDFSFKRNVMLNVIEHCKSLIVLDHHKTAQAELDNEIDQGKENIDIEFDMKRSGAGMAWDYFFGGRRPFLVDYAEDRDLWRFQLYRSREVNAFIQSFDINLDTWHEQVGPSFENANIDEIGDIGVALLRQQSKLVKSIAEHAELKMVASGEKVIKGPFVYTTILMSEVCEQMLKDFPDSPFSWYAFKRKDGKIQYGLRSRSKENFDVSEIAKAFGGGGHKNAAGFELDKEL